MRRLFGQQIAHIGEFKQSPAGALGIGCGQDQGAAAIAAIGEKECGKDKKVHLFQAESCE